MGNEDYDFIEYTNKHRKYFLKLIKRFEEKEGRKLTREELIDIGIKNKDKNLLNFLIFLGEEKREKRITEILLKHKDLNHFFYFCDLDFNYNFNEEEVEELEKELNDYWKEGVLDFYTTITKCIEDENFKLVIYLEQMETKKEIANIKIKINKRILNRMRGEELSLKKYKDRIVKNLSYFKEVFTIKEADVLLIIRKFNHSSFDLRLNKFTEEDLESIRNANAEIFYLKNTNPHDKLSTIMGYINRLATEVKQRNIL